MEFELSVLSFAIKMSSFSSSPVHKYMFYGGIQTLLYLVSPPFQAAAFPRPLHLLGEHCAYASPSFPEGLSWKPLCHDPPIYCVTQRKRYALDTAHLDRHFRICRQELVPSFRAVDRSGRLIPALRQTLPLLSFDNLSNSQTPNSDKAK